MAEDNDEDQAQIPEGTGRVILTGGAVVGGFFLIRGLLRSGKQERLNQIENQISKTQSDIKNEIDNAGNISDGELRSHIQTYKALSRSLNNNMPSEARLDLTQIENELKGESLATRALQWKAVTLQLLYNEYERVGNQSQLARLLSQAPGWVKIFLTVTTFLIGTVATISIIKRLIDFGKGGGGSGGLGTFSDWVRNGIFGSPDVLDDIEAPSDPSEKPTTITDPSPDPTEPPSRVITGSPRGAAEDTGVPDSLLAEILAILAIPAVVTISIGERTVELIASVTDKDKEFYFDNPSVAIIVVLVIVAAALIVAGSGGTGSAAAAAILLAVGGIIGVQFVGVDKVVPVGDQIRQSEEEL